MTTTLSKTISALRTILCFQIVFLHAAMTGLTNQELAHRMMDLMPFINICPQP